jgi:hypothetical protein
MKITIVGKVKVIGALKETDKMRSINIVITSEYDTNYPQHLSCELLNGKIELINGISVGDLITCEANLNGKEWQNQNTLETKYFNSINLWKITKN